VADIVPGDHGTGAGESGQPPPPPGLPSLPRTLAIAFTAAGAIVAAATAIGFFVASFNKSGSSLLEITLAFFAAGCIAIVIGSVWYRYRGKEVTIPVGTVTGGAFLALALGAGIGYIARQPVNVATGAPQRQGVPTATSTATSGLSFRSPQNGARVKQCLQVSGNGSIPPGMVLWIVVVPDISATPEQYWLESRAVPSGRNSWAAESKISIGPPDSSGVTAYIYAVLLDKQWSDYFEASSADYQPSLYAPLQPPHSGAVVGPVTVTRVAEPSGASCSP
jgi:hypothetical protein